MEDLVSMCERRCRKACIEIYYHDNFVFGHIFMFLTSFYAHFCVLCAQLVG